MFEGSNSYAKLALPCDLTTKALSAPNGVDAMFFVMRSGRITDDVIARPAGKDGGEGGRVKKFRSQSSTKDEN